MTRLHHYYHIYADAAWQPAVHEHFTALSESGLSEQNDFCLNIGVVGAAEKIDDVCEYLRTRDLSWRLVASAAHGWEQLTLTALWSDAPSMDGPVLYAHTKGAHDTNEFNQAWRRRMTHFTVTKWRDAVTALHEYDAYGCHWMELEGSWFFGGNFWWTHMKHLRLLEPPRMENRWKAEEWVGHLREKIEGFRVFDPAPGFPGTIQGGGNVVTHEHE